MQTRSFSLLKSSSMSSLWLTLLVKLGKIVPLLNTSTATSSSSLTSLYAAFFVLVGNNSRMSRQGRLFACKVVSKARGSKSLMSKSEIDLSHYSVDDDQSDESDRNSVHAVFSFLAMISPSFSSYCVGSLS